MNAFPYPERIHGAGFWPVNIKLMQNNVVKDNKRQRLRGTGYITVAIPTNIVHLYSFKDFGKN